MNKNLQHDSIHTGSTFQSFLEEEGISEEVRCGALKQLAENLEASPTKETTAVAMSGRANPNRKNFHSLTPAMIPSRPCKITNKCPPPPKSR